MGWLKRLIETILGWFGVREITPPAPDSRDDRGEPVMEAGDSGGDGRVTTDPDAPVGGTVEDTVEWDPLDHQEGRDVPRPTLSKGDKGDMVEELQRLLNANGAGIAVDGDFGNRTMRAVMSLDQSYGLSEDGTADAATWEVLDRPPFWEDDILAKMPLEPGTEITGGSSSVRAAWNSYGGLLQEVASRLGFSPAAAVAVLCAESSGRGFADDGRMIIRFENHCFYSRWGRSHPDQFAKHFRYNADQKWTGHYWREDPNGEWRRLHTRSAGQDEEWAALTFARTLDDEAALDSISMGSPQVMGFNSARIGYGTAREMFDNWSKGDRQQLLGLFSFIRSNHKMVRALRDEDWEAFAYRYNGSGQAAAYGGHIEDHVGTARSAGVP